MLAAPHTGEVFILDDVHGSLKLLALAGTFFLAGVVILPALLFYGIYEWSAWLLGSMFLVIGGGLLLQIGPRILRRDTPYLVVTPAGFRCPGLADAVVPWSGIDHAAVSDDPIVCTDFFFKPGAPLPVRDRSRANVHVVARRRMVSIRGPAPHGMSLTEYGAIIGNAIEAAQSADADGH